MDNAALNNLLNAINSVRPEVGTWYDFQIYEDRVRGKVLCNYKHFTLFQEASGWRFCLTPWEIRRYSV